MHGAGFWCIFHAILSLLGDVHLHCLTGLTIRITSSIYYAKKAWWRIEVMSKLGFDRPLPQAYSNRNHENAVFTEPLLCLRLRINLVQCFTRIVCFNYWEIYMQFFFFFWFVELLMLYLNEIILPISFYGDNEVVHVTQPKESST